MTYLLSVDVEDWFQVENLKGVIPRDSWGSQQLRVELNIEIILGILHQADTCGTFFVLGWIAERCPQLVRRIHSLGHEIASHGYGHALLPTLTQHELTSDLKRSKELLEDITGDEVLGYRAPSFSITDQALDVLAEQGYAYDSSLFCTKLNQRYGSLSSWSGSDGPIQELEQGIMEVSLSCCPLAGLSLPWAGGGYFRLLPYPVFQRGVCRAASRHGMYTFYVHPWEFDPEQPRMTGLPRQLKFRHYVNLEKTGQRFARLVGDFPFEPIRAIIQDKNKR